MKSISLNALLSVMLLFAVPLAITATEGEAAAPGQSEIEALPLDELKTFTQVFTKIKNDYVQEVNDRELLENAIRGMLEGLDPHSAYLDRNAYHDLQEGTSGEFGGLGIEVGMENGVVKVVSPIDDTPAERAGIEAPRDAARRAPRALHLGAHHEDGQERVLSGQTTIDEVLRVTQRKTS